MLGDVVNLLLLVFGNFIVYSSFSSKRNMIEEKKRRAWEATDI